MFINYWNKIHFLRTHRDTHSYSIRYKPTSRICQKEVWPPTLTRKRNAVSSNNSSLWETLRCHPDELMRVFTWLWLPCHPCLLHSTARIHARAWKMEHQGVRPHIPKEMGKSEALSLHPGFWTKLRTISHETKCSLFSLGTKFSLLFLWSSLCGRSVLHPAGVARRPNAPKAAAALSFRATACVPASVRGKSWSVINIFFSLGP